MPVMDQTNGVRFVLGFCYLLGCFLTTSTSYSALVKQVLIPENSTSLTVEVCTGINVTWMTIVDKELTWFEGIALCEDMGFGAIDIALPTWARRNQLRKYLEDIDYKGLNYSFWTGIFRSVNQETKWYYQFKKCRKFRNSVDVDYLTDGLCTIIVRNESSPYKENIVVDDCSNRHPFICTKYPGNATFLAFKGFDIPGINITKDIRPSTLTNVTSELCKGECFYYGGCTAFTFNHDMNNCTLFQMAFATKNYLNYTITESIQNVTHYAKTGCQLNFTSGNITITSNINTTVPDCTKDETGAYCPCNVSDSSLTEHEIETIVNELVANLTVDPKATAASRRKLNSAEDSRPTSRVVGTFGIITMAVMLSLPVIADCFLPGIKVKSKIK